MKIRTSRRSQKIVLEMDSKDSGSLRPFATPEFRIKRILAPVDFSACSRKAFHYAIHFARLFQAELMLLHVVVKPPPPSQAPVLQLVLENDIAYHEQAAKELDEWRREASRATSVKSVLREGMSAHKEIVEAARETNTDLIIIGNHGRTGLSRLWTGGTTERVVRYAPCPVLVIREREHDFVADDEATASAASSDDSHAHAE